MGDLTNRVSIKRTIEKENAIEKSKTKKLGIIFTGEYEGLDEHLVEAEVRKHFDIDSIKEIVTVGKREKTHKYANRFAKKIEVPVTATPLENYTWDDIDLPIKRNSIIVYYSDSVIIFHGEKEHNTIAWFALSGAKRVLGIHGKVVFVNTAPTRVLSGFEKEIFDVVQIRDTNLMCEDDALMEKYLFEFRRSRLTSFAKYVQLGEKMNFKDVLFKISELSVRGQSEGVYDGISFICDTIFNFLIPMLDEDFSEENEDDFPGGIVNFIRENVNSNYQPWGDQPEDNECFILLKNRWYQLEFMMDYIEPSYWNRNENEEIYVALCFCKWILIMNSRCIETEEIAEKYKSVKDFISTIK